MNELAQTMSRPTTTVGGWWGRIYWGIADTIVVARRHILHIPQTPEQLVSATVQPVIFVLLFRYIFGGAIETPGMSYVNYLMAGIFVQSIVMEGTTGGIGLAYDFQQGIIDRFRSLPMAPSAVLVGPIIADLLRNIFVIGVMVAVGLAVGFRPEAGPVGWLLAITLLLATSVAISSVGTMIAMLVRDPEAVQTISFVVILPLAFGSGAFVPVDTMPGWLQPIVEYQPVTVIADAVRNLLLDQPAGSGLWGAFAWCAAITLIALPLSVGLFRRAQQG